MASVSSAVARESPQERESHLPGGPDIWVFVLGDMLIFSCYFMAYVFQGRAKYAEVFAQSQPLLSQSLGILNTLLLLTSSLFVALCVAAARVGERRSARRFVELGGACGLGFLALKSFEWSGKLRAGLTIGTNPFFTHYYVMTGVHVLHVLIGLVFLLLIRRELSGPTPPRIRLLEAGGAYWHMVDFLWFLIFALLYLMR